MRSSKQIINISDLIKIYWLKHPDLRFFQLIDYIKSLVEKETKIDSFQLDNTTVENFLNDQIKELYK